MYYEHLLFPTELDSATADRRTLKDSRARRSPPVHCTWLAQANMTQRDLIRVIFCQHLLASEAEPLITQQIGSTLSLNLIITLG